MRRPWTADLLLVAGPPLLLAVVGLFHPSDLTADSAAAWRNLHVVLLPVFPLLALGPWVLVRGEHAAVRWAVAVLGFGYAVLYTALDVLAGIGAGALKAAGAGTEWTSVMFDQGNDLSTYGVWAYLVATVIAGGAVLARAGVAALPGAMIVAGAAWSFLGSHIYWPVGGLTMIALAIGWAALVVARALGTAPWALDVTTAEAEPTRRVV
jgi:hypothetical protein